MVLAIVEIVVIAVIVGVAVAWAVRAARRSLRRDTGCATCGDVAGCPLVKDPEALARLQGRCEQDAARTPASDANVKDTATPSRSA